MILDKQNQYSDAQAVTGTVVSTNIIDHLASPSGLEAGEPMGVFLNVPTVDDNTANVTVNVQTSDTDVFTVATTIATKTIPLAELVAGLKEWIALNPGYKAQRYTRVQFVASTSEFTVDAYFAPLSHQDKFFAVKDNVKIAQ